MLFCPIETKSQKPTDTFDGTEYIIHSDRHILSDITKIPQK